jgi:hypothetical protein
MQFMLTIKSDEQAEAGVLPDEKIMSEMTKFNEAMVEAGVLVSAEALHPTSKGTRIALAGGKRTTSDGPFAEAKEVIAGYWLLRAKSKADAVEWAKRCPGAAGKLELRQVYELDDFPVDAAEGTDGWRAKEERMRDELEHAPEPAAKPGTLRFIAMLKSDKYSESGVLPDEQMLSRMGKLMEDMANAGVAVGGEGLQPSAKGVRIQQHKVIDGPFTESKEMIAGFTMLRCKSKAEAIEWSWRWLDIHCSGNFASDGEIEIRQVFELSELPPSEAVERAKRLDQQLGKR